MSMQGQRMLLESALLRARVKSGRCALALLRRHYSQHPSHGQYGHGHPQQQQYQYQPYQQQHQAYAHAQQQRAPGAHPHSYQQQYQQQPRYAYQAQQGYTPPPPPGPRDRSDGKPQQGSWQNPLIIMQTPNKALLDQISHALTILILLNILWWVSQNVMIVEDTGDHGQHPQARNQQQQQQQQRPNSRSDSSQAPPQEGAPPPSSGGINALFGGYGGKEAVKPVDLNSINHSVKFSDVLGCDEAKSELQEVCQFLQNPDKFTRLGGKLPKGYMLVGPPGTGKTMLAKAIAKEAEVPFFYTSGAQFEEKFVGVGSKRVRELFEAAREKSPCLIFIDEIDAVGGKRSGQDASHDRATINQLLSEMDGFNSSDGIVVIAATNSPQTLDKALTRPGRFDRSVSVAPPDLKGRTQILEHYLQKVTADPKLDPKSIARGTGGMTGADLSNVVNLATISAAKKNLDHVTLECMEEAKDRVTMGIAHRSKKIPQHERENTAYHEAGHALVALFSDNATVLHKATIIPRGQSLGVTQQLPPDNQVSLSLSQMKDRLKVLMGGRIAEEVVFGHKEVTSGASNDLQQASNLARSMVRKYGLSSNLGCVDYSFADDPQGIFLSNKTRQKIEEEVKSLVDQAHKEAYDVITSKREVLNQIAAGLLENETLSGQEMRKMANLPEPEQDKA